MSLAPLTGGLIGSKPSSGYGPCPAALSIILIILTRLCISNLLTLSTLLTLAHLLPFAEAVSVPKIDVQLEGSSNYKRWALVVKGTLVLMGYWYAVTKSKPTAQTGTVTLPGGTTGTGILNEKEIDEWTEANDSAAAVISMSCGETAVNLLDQSWTATTMWDTLKTAYGTVSTMEA